MPVPEGRIDMGGAPEIDIANDHLGALFIERRRILGLKVEEIAEDIKIKSEYLKAIEREEFELLPTPEYARLFVRAYAERLGFNINEVFALLDVNMAGWGIAARPKHSAPVQEGGQLTSPLPGTTASAPPDSRRRPGGMPLLLGIFGIIIVLGLIAWFVLGLRSDSTTGDVRDETSVSQAALSGGSVPAVASTQPAETPEPAPESTLAEEPDASWETLHLVLHFTEETWASLQADGDNVANSIFQPGSSLEAYGAQTFRLSLGHTVGVTATVNGHPLRPFRDWASRLEGHLIDRDSIRAWQVGEPADTSTSGISLQSDHVDVYGPKRS